MCKSVYNLYFNVWRKYRTDEEIAGIIPYNNVFQVSLGLFKLAFNNVSKIKSKKKTELKITRLFVIIRSKFNGLLTFSFAFTIW